MVSVGEEVEDRFPAEFEGFDDAQDAFDEAAAGLAVTAERGASPEYRSALDAFGVVVGWLDAVVSGEGEEGGRLGVQSLAERRDAWARVRHPVGQDEPDVVLVDCDVLGPLLAGKRLIPDRHASVRRGDHSRTSSGLARTSPPGSSLSVLSSSDSREPSTTAGGRAATGCRLSSGR